MSHYYSLSLSSYDFGNVTAYSEYDNYEYKAGAASANARPIIKKNEEDDASNESAADARAPNRNASSGSGNGENYYDDCDEYDGEMYSALSFLLDDEAAAAAAAANGGNIRAHHRHLSSLTVYPEPMQLNENGYRLYPGGQTGYPTEKVLSAPPAIGSVHPGGMIMTQQQTSTSYSSSDEDDESNPEKWKERFQQLVQFKKLYGHCNVPQRQYENGGSAAAKAVANMDGASPISKKKKKKKYPSYQGDLNFGALGRWVKRQRYHYKRKQIGKHNNLTDEREQALTDLGLEWDIRGMAWEDKMMELREFVKEHGHANVPVLYKKNRQLGLWLKRQRAQYKAYCTMAMTENTGENSTATSAGANKANKKKKSTSISMTPARIAKLEELGVNWNGHRCRGGRASPSCSDSILNESV